MFPIATPAGRLPQRSDSLHPQKGLSFNQIDEELRDIRRVHAQGQEEDLRMALSRTIGRVEELSSMLRDAFKAQTDMQTELTLAKSNLQLALANNEMLEDALKREGGAGHAKDIGWRRLGAKEQKERERASADSRRHSMESIASVDGTSSSSVVTPSSPMPSASAPVPATAESRFFKFRFGNAPSPAPSPRLPATPNPNGAFQASHLTSASLPSLVPARDKDKELEDLTDLLDRERKAHKDATAAKAALEAELESLSQALFEEANKMVAAERMKFSELEEELKEAHAEKEALRSALRLMENQRIDADSRVASRVASPDPSVHRVHASSVAIGSMHSVHAHKRSSSSAIAVKSLPGSGPSSPRSAMHITDVLELEADAVEQGTGASLRARVPPPLTLTDDVSPASPTPPAAAVPSDKPPQTAPADLAASDKPSASADEAASSLSAPPIPAASSASLSAGSSDLSSSPTPSPGQFLSSKPAAQAPLSYFGDEEPSPWADVRSQTPVSAAF